MKSMKAVSQPYPSTSRSTEHAWNLRHPMEKSVQPRSLVKCSVACATFINDDRIEFSWATNR